MLNTDVRRKAAKALVNSLAVTVLVSAAALLAGCGEPKIEGPPPLIPGKDASAPKLTPGAPPGGLPGATTGSGTEKPKGDK